MHFAGTLPSPNGRERIASTRCYALASGEYNSRAYAAMPDRPMTHRGSISPAKPPFGCTRSSMLVPTVPRPSPSAGCGGALTCGPPGARGPSAAGSQPAEAWSRLGRGTYWDAGVRLQLGRAYAPPRCPPTRRAGAAAGMHCVGTEPSASRAPSVERGGIRPRAFAGAGQCRRLRAIPASGPTALQEHQ